MDEKENYKGLLSEIIAKQIVILGPNIAVLKARSVSVLTVTDEGQVTDIKGDPNQALQALIDTYVNLSGEIVKNALGSVFAKYPTIQKIA